MLLTHLGAREGRKSGGGATAPGGANTQLQYNNAGAFGGANATYDNVKGKITFGPSAAFAGFNFGSVAGNPATTTGGDAWFNSTSGEYQIFLAGGNRNLAAYQGAYALGQIPYLNSTTNSLFSSNAQLFYDTASGEFNAQRGIFLRGNGAGNINLSPVAGDPASSIIGDEWYNSTLGKYRGRNASGSFSFAQDNQIGGNNVSASVLSPGAGQDGMALYWNNGTVQYDLKTITATPAGSNTQVQFNNSGALGASANFTYAGGNQGLIVQAANATGTTDAAAFLNSSGGLLLEISNQQTNFSGGGGRQITVKAGSAYSIFGSNSVAANENFTINAGAGNVGFINGANLILQGGSGAAGLNGNGGNATISGGSKDGVGTPGTTFIATAAGSFLSFFNVAGVVQQTNAAGLAAFVANAGTAINTLSTFDGYTIPQIVKILRNYGLCA